MDNSLYLGLGVSLIALLTGCGGGGGGGSSGGGTSANGPAKPGLYVGFLREEGESQLILSVGADGQATFVNEAPGTYASGSITFSDSELNGSINQFQLGRLIASGDLTGNSTTTSFSGTSFRENADGTLVEDGSFKFDRVPQLSDISTSLSQIAATWTDIRTASPTTTINIDPNGMFTGGDTNCTFAGSLRMPDPKINLFEVDYSTSDCQDDADYPDSGFSAEEQSGEYQGYSYYAPANSNDPERLVFLADNGKISRYFVFEN